MSPPVASWNLPITITSSFSSRPMSLSLIPWGLFPIPMLIGEAARDVWKTDGFTSEGLSSTFSKNPVYNVFLTCYVVFSKYSFRKSCTPVILIAGSSLALAGTYSFALKSCKLNSWAFLSWFRAVDAISALENSWDFILAAKPDLPGKVASNGWALFFKDPKPLT